MKPDKTDVGDPGTSALCTTGRTLGDSVIKSPTKPYYEPSSGYPLMTYIQSSNQREPPLPRNPSVIRKNGSCNQISELPVGSVSQDSEPLPKKRRLLELVDCNDNHELKNIALDASLVPSHSIGQISPLYEDALTRKPELSRRSHEEMNLSCRVSSSVSLSGTMTSSISTTSTKNQLIFPTSAVIKVSESNVNTEVTENQLCLHKVDLSKESDATPNPSTRVDNSMRLTKTREAVITSTDKIISSNSLTASSSKSKSNSDLCPKVVQRRINEQPAIPNFLAKKSEQAMDTQDILATACHAVGLDSGLMDISDVPEETNPSAATRNISGCHKPYSIHAPKFTTLARSVAFNSRKKSVPNSPSILNGCQNPQSLYNCGPYAQGNQNHYLHPYRYINSTVVLPNRYPQPSNPYAYSNPYYHHPYSSTARNYPGTYAHFRPPDSQCIWPSANRPNFPGNQRPMNLNYQSPIRHPSLPPYQRLPQNSHLGPCRYESTSNDVYSQTPINSEAQISISQQGDISPNPQIYCHPKHSPQQAAKAVDSTVLSPPCPPQSPQYSTTREEFYQHNRLPFGTQIPTPMANKGMISPPYLKPPESTHNSKADNGGQYSDTFYSQNPHYQNEFSMQTDPNEYSKSVIGGNGNMQGQFIIEKVRQYSYPPYRYSEWKVPTYSSISENIKCNSTQPTTYSDTGSQNKQHVTSQTNTNNPYYATYSNLGNISHPHIYKNETCKQTPPVYNHCRTELPYPMANNSYSLIKHPPSQVPSTVNQDSLLNREKIGTERLPESLGNHLKNQNTVSHTYMAPYQPYSPDVPFTTTYASSSNLTYINSMPLSTTDINMDEFYNSRCEESVNIPQHENGFTLSSTISKNDPINYEMISPGLQEGKKSGNYTPPNNFMPPLTVPNTHQVSGILSKTPTTESGLLDASLVAKGISPGVNLPGTPTVSKPTSESNLNRNDILSPSSCMSQKPSAESFQQKKSYMEDKPLYRTSGTSKEEQELPVEDLNKKSPLDSSELAIGSFLLNKGYATFMDAGVESKESLFKQKLLPVIDHLLSIPEAASLRPLRFCPDQLLDHLVKLWGGKDANSTAADCYLRMKENFLSLVKFLFKPHLLVEWGWDKAPPEQILDELLSSSEQGDLFSQTTFGNLSRLYTPASASTSLSVSLSPQSSSSEDDVFSVTQSIPYNSLPDVDFPYLNTIATTTSGSDSGATAKTEDIFLKNIISNGVLNNDKRDNSLSNGDKGMSSFITKTNSNFSPLSKDNSSTTDNGFSRQRNEIIPNLSRIEDMIPCILEENLELCKKKESWSSNIKSDAHSPSNSVTNISIKSVNPFKENCKPSVCDSEVEIYSCKASNSLVFDNKDCSTELSPDMKNKKRKSLEEVEKELNNHLSSYCTQTKPTEYCISANSPQNHVFETQVDREAEWKELTEHLVEFKQTRQYKITDPVDLQFGKKESSFLDSRSTKEIEGENATEISQSVQTNLKSEVNESIPVQVKTLSCDNLSANSISSTKESAIWKDKMTRDENRSRHSLNSSNDAKMNIKILKNDDDSINETKIEEGNKVQCQNPMSGKDSINESCVEDSSLVSTINAGEKTNLNSASHTTQAPPNMDNLEPTQEASLKLEKEYAPDKNVSFSKKFSKGGEVTGNNLISHNHDNYLENDPHEGHKRITEITQSESPDSLCINEKCNRIIESKNPTKPRTNQEMSFSHTSTLTTKSEEKASLANDIQSSPQNKLKNISKPSMKKSKSSQEINTFNMGHSGHSLSTSRFDSPNLKKDFVINSKPISDYTSIFKKYVESKLLTSNDIKNIENDHL